VLLFKQKDLILINLSREGHKTNMVNMNNMKLTCIICKNPVRVQQKMKSASSTKTKVLMLLRAIFGVITLVINT